MGDQERRKDDRTASMLEEVSLIGIQMKLREVMEGKPGADDVVAGLKPLLSVPTPSNNAIGKR